MPYYPLERDDLPPRRRRRREARKGRWLVLLGLVLLIAPFMITFFATQGASAGYKDGKGNWHAAVPISKDQREAARRDPPRGSVNRLAAPNDLADYLIYLSVGTCLVLMACGLFKMTPRR